MSTDPDALPPSVADAVFAIQTAITINAPADTVWRVLMDFRAYPEWNPFVREQYLADEHGAELVSQTPRAGARLHMRVHLPPSLGPPRLLQLQSARTRITLVDNTQYRAAWANETLPRALAWALHGARWQALVPVEAGGTRYETVEVFKGPVAWVLRVILRAKLQEGFDAMAAALKERAEREAAGA